MNAMRVSLDWAGHWILVMIGHCRLGISIALGASNDWHIIEAKHENSQGTYRHAVLAFLDSEFRGTS